MLELMEAPADAGASDRFWSKVDKTDECWIWTSAINTQGYGHFKLGRRVLRAHRLAYEWLVGLIPPGRQLHHRCGVRHCVNPVHLELVSAEDHYRLDAGHNGNKTHCHRGHAFTPENTSHRTNGHRRCLTCHRENQRRYNAER